MPFRALLHVKTCLESFLQLLDVYNVFAFTGAVVNCPSACRCNLHALSVHFLRCCCALLRTRLILGKNAI